MIISAQRCTDVRDEAVATSRWRSHFDNQGNSEPECFRPRIRGFPESLPKFFQEDFVSSHQQYADNLPISISTGRTGVESNCSSCRSPIP